MNRIPFQKQTSSGGTVNPYNLQSNYLPMLRELSDAEWEIDMQEAIEVINQRSRGEWPTQMFTNWGVKSDIPLPLVDLVQDQMDSKMLSQAEACADLVHMDEPLELAQLFGVWAREVGLQPKAEHVRARNPHIDFIGNVVAPSQFMVDGLDEAMEICLKEKSYWNACRPEEVIEDASGIKASVSTFYPEGCPLHGERPAGHGVFAGYVAKRAEMYYEGSIKAFANAGKHIGLWRVIAGVHTPRSCIEGFDLGVRLAANN